MSISVKNWPLVLAVVKLLQSMLAQRQTPAPDHIGLYGGSFLDMHNDDH